jgi:hypothetical protein
MDFVIESGAPESARKGVSPKASIYSDIANYFNAKLTEGQFFSVPHKTASKSSIKKHAVPMFDVTHSEYKLISVKGTEPATKIYKIAKVVKATAATV